MVANWLDGLSCSSVGEDSSLPWRQPPCYRGLEPIPHLLGLWTHHWYLFITSPKLISIFCQNKSSSYHYPNLCALKVISSDNKQNVLLPEGSYLPWVKK